MLTDRHGNTVTTARIDGTEVYIARAPNGILLGRYLGDGAELRTPADLARAGVDLASLA